MGTHSQAIEREHPGCFIMLIDQSKSMDDPWKGSKQATSKAEEMAVIVNKSLSWLVNNSGADEEGMYHYFDVAVIGYGNNLVKSALTGELAASSLVTGPQLYKGRTVKEIDGIKRFSWIEPCANGNTPMAEALEMGWRLAEGWARAHRNCFPPVVFNFTDGQANDEEFGDPVEVAEHLRSIETNDGLLTLFNVSISGEDGSQIAFPSSPPNQADPWARKLFEMSSVLPEVMRIRLDDPEIKPGARAFVMNADAKTALEALQVGTQPDFDHPLR